MRFRPAVVVAVFAVLAGASPAIAALTTDDKTVSYHGYQVVVPHDWRVVDLGLDPTACVRFDHPAVYLGHSSVQPNCPAQPVGRIAGLVIEPLSTRRDLDPNTATAGAGAATASAPSVDGEIQVAVEDAGVLVTGYHAPGRERQVRSVLDSARLISGGTKTLVPAVRPHATTPVVAVSNLQAQAFDACTAPSQATMDAWRYPASPYKALGVYISGALRACAQPNLTPSWVTTNASRGWQFLLIDSGMQAPCTRYSSKMSADPATARGQGRTAADASVTKAAGLLFGQRSAIYADLEAYTSTPSCKAAVLSYVSGWTQELHARGYVSGVYTAAGSGGVDLSSGYADASYTRPDNLWFARWNGLISTGDDMYIPSADWTNRERVHQFAGDQTETHGGAKLNIDRSSANLTAPPAPATAFDATGQFVRATLSWTHPGGTQTIVRASAGTVAPATPTSGAAVYTGTAGTATASGLANATSYTFRAWTKDSTGKIGPGVYTQLIGTRSTAAASGTSIGYGGSVTLHGRLVRTADGVAVGGARLSLYARAKNSPTWHEVVRPTTNASGYVIYVHKPTVSTVYQWGYNGSVDLLGSRSTNLTVEVRPAITASVSAATIRLGTSTGFYGYLRPQHPGQAVYLQRLNGSAWLTVSTTKLTSSGDYRFTVRPGARGTFSYRAMWLADGDHATTVSATKMLKVS